MSGPAAESMVRADDGVALSVRSRGRGRRLLLCHGGPGLWDNLDDLAALLGELFTVWTYDQRGCGRSAGREGPYTVARFVADLDAVRQAMGYERVIVGGHSWGAVLGFLYAAAHPERVDGLLYIAGAGIEWPKWRPQHRDEARRRLASQPFADLASQPDDRVVRWAIDFADPAVGLARAREAAASGFEVNTECNSALNAELSAVPEVTVPVLVLQGERDPRPLQAVESMLNALPAARRVVLRGAGHYPWVERPEELRREVEAWSRVLPTELVRTEDFSGAPPPEVLRQFGVTQAPTRFSFGRGHTWAAGDLVLKPVDDVEEAAWIAELVSRLQQRGFRLAQPVSAPDGRWIVDGWSASTRVAGEHSTTRWPEMLKAASAFHAAVAAETKPEFIERRADRWRIADRIAWGELPVGDLGQIGHVERLVRAWRPVDLPSQLIHGDLVGNVLFAEGLPPAIIDLSLYWRPPGYSAALVAGDAIAWEGADRSVLDLIRRFEQWPQLLLRAVIFRVVVSELAKRAEPWRADITHEYDEIVDLAVSLAAA